MQVYVVTWKFSSAEDQFYAKDEFFKLSEDYDESFKDFNFEVIAWVHMPQDGTGMILCKTNECSELYRFFGPLRDRYDLTFEFKPGFFLHEMGNLFKT